MKGLFTLLLSAAALGATAQTTISNGGFENWGNTVPAGDTYTEPTGWYSNQSGSSIATLGPETCFKDSTNHHSGSYSVRVETVAGPLSTVVNGNVTTGVINAPTITKTDGYIGTVNYSTSTDVRHMPFTGRPDSLVGWFMYTSGGGGEQGKVRAILHTGDYYDPETPTTYHPACIANKIGDAQFLTPFTSVAGWTRFSVPFTYTGSSAPSYIMINVTSSANQATTVTGSKLWLDDLQAVYATTKIGGVKMEEQHANVYSSGSTVYVHFADGNGGVSVLSLYDLTGRKVFSASVLHDGTSSFNLPNLKAGIYLYQLSNTDYCKTGKLFIQ